MTNEKKQMIYTSACNKSKKMTDYDFSLDNSRLYLNNKMTNETDFVIVDVNDLKSDLSLIKCLLMSNDKNNSKYYTIKDLKIIFKDYHLSLFRINEKNDDEESKAESEITLKPNNCTSQTSKENSSIYTNSDTLMKKSINDEFKRRKLKNSNQKRRIPEHLKMTKNKLLKLNNSSQTVDMKRSVNSIKYETIAISDIKATCKINNN